MYECMERNKMWNKENRCVGTLVSTVWQNDNYLKKNDA